MINGEQERGRESSIIKEGSRRSLKRKIHTIESRGQKKIVEEKPGGLHRKFKIIYKPAVKIRNLDVAVHGYKHFDLEKMAERIGQMDSIFFQ